MPPVSLGNSCLAELANIPDGATLGSVLAAQVFTFSLNLLGLPTPNFENYLEDLICDHFIHTANKQ